MDGQILGQLRPLAEQEEEEEEEGARAAPSTRPAFPGMGSEELRLASFYDWPLTAVVRPELLAAAGFFHTGEFWGPGCHSGPCWPGAPPPGQGGSGPDTEGGRGPAAFPHLSLPLGVSPRVLQTVASAQGQLGWEVYGASTGPLGSRDRPVPAPTCPPSCE